MVALLRCQLPRRYEPLELRGHVGDGVLVRHLARKPFVRGVGEDRAADREAFDKLRTGSNAKGADELGFGRVEAEHNDAATVRIMHSDDFFYRAPRDRAQLRL